MWVAIYNDTGAGGTVRVEEFRQRTDVATAVSQFQNDYTPPATEYAGINVGWTAYADAPPHHEWHVDRDAVPLAMVAVPVPMQLVFKASRFVTEAAIMGTTTVILDGLRSRLATWFGDPSEAIGSLTGEIKVGGGSCSLRIMMGDDGPGNPIVPLSVDFVQPDTAGAWVPFTMISGTNPTLDLQRYFVEGETSDAAAFAEIRYASFSIFAKG
jgi:hypothetical protein